MTDAHDEPAGTRAIRLEVEVPGTPEEVWATIATGPGIASWFVPAEVAEREGGRISLEFAPGMVETGEVTAWEPPHRFRYVAPEEGDRQLAYEWLVEAREGGTCVVRLVNTGFGAGADWDGDYDGMTSGWKLFLENLRLHLTHFPGQRATAVIAGARASGPEAEAWSALLRAAGLDTAPAEGDAVALRGDGVPELAGRAVRVAPNMVTLLVDRPGPGVAFLAAEGNGGPVYVSAYLYLHGDGAAEIAERERPAWEAWIASAFPAPAPAGAS